MKNFFKSLVVGALLLGSVGCSDMFKEEIYDIYNELDNINARIDSLCNAVNTNIASLQTIIDVMQDNDYVDSITPIVEGGETVGYEIVFTQSGSVKIYHGKKGETGHTPIVGVQQAEDGRWYWTIDGEWLLDGEGDKVLAEAIDGIDGEKGEEGITPKLEVRDNYWYISYDNGATWVQLGKATGENGKDGDSMFKSISYNEDYVELVLADGKTVIKIPTWASHMLLVDEIAKINSNISAIQAAIEALESNDYVQKVTPVKDEDGNVIGYTLQFVFTGDVTIYHGEDGKDGEDGEDGKDGVDGEDGKDGKDGYTPVIGARQHPDGNWYWTVDTEWLLDTNGNRVKTTGEDGTSGITPELKIEDDYWYVSYDKGQTWTKLGKAKGEDGADGECKDGDSFFKDVNVTEDYVTFTLANGTEIKIPTWKVYQELADAVAHLNTNVQSMQTIIAAIQNNDFVTGTSEIVDHQTNEVIGYKLHFSKSGDIEIYHGKTPNAPKIGIKKHPQYGNCWAYNDQYIYDEAGKPVALPQDGSDAIAPKFKIEGGRWWMSTDGGDSWDDIGQATGDQGEQGEQGDTGELGDSFFKSVKEEKVKDANGNDVVAYIVMTLADGSEYRVPTAYITDELTKRIAAIEGKFAAINTIVNALQNAEYIKEIVELYDDSTPPLHVGYEITFVKYTIGTNGNLAETTRKRTIRTGDAGAAGTKVAAEYDEATDTWYWTLDGEPLKDKDGNYVAINGKNGKPGATPRMRISTETNFWEVSYDGGNTWESTGVKATGPKGETGDGKDGDSFFAGVYKDGDYWVFELEKGEKIKVPTAEAFASLAGRVAALEKSAESILSLVNGKKYIESCEPFSNDSGSGYHLVLVSLNAETGEATKEDCFIYNGIAGNTPVVGLRQDEATGDWYWTVDGEDLLVDGKPVKANGPEPSFHIDQNGHLWVNVNGNEKDLGNVIGAGGGSGADASILVEEVKDDAGKPTGELIITFMSGTSETGKISVPSWAKFVELQNAVTSLTINVETISALVYGHKYVESFKELENGGYEFVVRYYDENAKEWKTEVHTIDITTADEIGVKKDETDNNYYWTKGGEWLLDAAGNRVMVDGSAERILEFDSKNDGKLYYKYSDETEWTVLDIAVSESVVDSNVVVKEEDGKVTVTVLDDAGMVLYFFTAPSWEAFEALQGRVIALEEQVTDINDLIDQLTTNYQELSGDVKNMKDKLAKCKFIGEYEYDEERKGHVIYLVDIDGNKLKDAAGEYETIFIADGEDGEDFDASMLSFTEVDGEYFWTYNGEMLVDAAGKPVKAHGADGRTPEFDLIDDELVYRYEGDEEWISLGNVKGSAAAANITVDPSDVPMWIEIEYSYVDEDGKESVSKIKVPTYHAYEMAVDEIEAIESTIEMVETFLKGNKFVSDYELTYDQNGMVSGCTVTTVEYKLQEDGSYRAFPSETEFNPSQTMSVKLENDVWYLVFYNEKGEEVKRPLSQSAFTFVPEVAVNNGYIYVAKVSEPGNDYADTQKWECLGAVVELLGGETGSVQGALKSVEEIDGYICFTFSNGDVLTVPSDAKFQEVLDSLDEVKNTVAGLQPLLDGNTFITGITPVTENGVVVGFTYTSVTVDENGDLKTNDDESTVSLTGIVIPNGEDGYKVLTGYDESGKPVYVELSTSQTPVFGVYNGAVYMSVDKGADAKKIKEQITNVEDGISWIVVFKVADVVGTYTEITDNGVVVGYKISFPNPSDPEKPIEYEVAKFITTPQIEFSKGGTTITDLNIGGESSMDVTCTIIGSFPNDYDLKVYAACEGHFTSSMKEVKQDQDDKNKYTVDITISPNAVYDSDFNGKLTVYCPYYGNTGIGQLNLTATGVGIEIKSVEKSGNDLNATISLDGIVEKSGEKLQVKVVGGDFDSNDPWISMGGVKNPSNSKIEQTLNLTSYVIGSKEDSENNYDRTSRTCTLAVVTPSGREAGYVQINQAPIINLADQGSANCYIISAPGRYMIPAREGNSSTPLWTGTTPPSNLKLTLVNSDVSGGQVNLLSEQTATIFNYKEKDYIVFEVPNAITAGNTIVSLKSGNEILWSWHLWFCKNKITDQKYPEEDGTFENKYVMDRPLGATDGINVDLSFLSALGGSDKYYVWSDGTYYQWGRKDPFLVNKDGALVGSEVASSGTYNSSTDKLIYNSNWTSTDGWGATKSKNDPCPPGYKVPSYNIWRENNSDEAGIWVDNVNISTTTYTAYTYNLTNPNNESGTLPDIYIFYGYNGYLKTDGKLYKKEPTTIDVTIPGPIEATNLTNPRRGRVRLTNVQLEVSAELYYGGLWSNSSSINLLYGYAGLDFSDFNSTSIQDQVTFKECMVSEGSGIFSVKWGDPYKITSLTDLEKLAVFGKVVLSGSSNKYVYDYDYSKNSPANGLQVRCVKE